MTYTYEVANEGGVLALPDGTSTRIMARWAAEEAA